MSYRRLDDVFGRDARDRSEQVQRAGFEGAVAALETFYAAFNGGDLSLLRSVWNDDDLVRLKNPLGGVLEGREQITDLYDTIFAGPAEVWVELRDVVAYELGEAVVFSGREFGEFTRSAETVPLEIRTTRVMHWADGRWSHVHHHGSITDTATLQSYRAAVTA